MGGRTARGLWWNRRERRRGKCWQLVLNSGSPRSGLGEETQITEARSQSPEVQGTCWGSLRALLSKKVTFTSPIKGFWNYDSDYLKGKKESDLLSANSLPEDLQQTGLGQFEVTSWKINSGFPQE